MVFIEGKVSAKIVVSVSLTLNPFVSEKIFLNNAGCLSDTINKVGSLPDEFFTILNERNYVLV